MRTKGITEILRQDFVARCQRNTNYSVRSFARFLEVDHSLLAKIIRGDKTLSKKMAYQVGEKLGMSLTQIKEMLEANPVKTNSQQITDDTLCVLSDWFHFAILELIKTKNFQASQDYISNTLGISKLETKLALERLERLEFIKLQNNQITLNKENNNWFDFTGTSDSRKFLQKGLLEKAKEAIDQVEFDRRINSSLSIAIDQDDLSEYQKDVSALIEKFDGRSINTKNKNDVYQLCVAFYPLTYRSEQ